MRLIPVGKSYAEVDDEDYERVISYSPRWLLHKVSNKFYAKKDFKKYGTRWTVLLHRYILDVHMLPGNSAPVDHRDHNGLNNQRENLILGTKSSNGINREGLQLNNTSSVHGVYWNSQKQKWHAEIMRLGKKIHVGFYTTIEEAEHARLLKELNL